MHQKSLFAAGYIRYFLRFGSGFYRTDDEKEGKTYRNPDIVFTQWPNDTHPDHQVTGCLTFNALIKSGQKFDLYYYEVDSKHSANYGLIMT